MAEMNIVWIIGTDFSGSTMLNLILGGHPESISVGELYKIYLNKGGCLKCQKRVKNCSLNAFLKRNKYSLETYYEGIRKYSGAKNIVDSSKNPNWFNLLIDGGVFKKENYNITPILLYKDIFRLCSSFLKYNAGFRKAFRNFYSRLSEGYKIVNEHGGMVIRYDDLADNIEAMIKMICNKSGFPYQKKMLTYHNNQHHHNIGGNSGTKKSFKEKRGDVVTDNSFENRLTELHRQNIMKRLVNGGCGELLEKLNKERILIV